MFNTIDEALEVLESRRNMTLGIEYLRKVLESLDNPQLKLKCIHIAGTNGKGSTTNFTRSILQHAGYKVGTFTSPHLIKHNDRIRINDVEISDSDLLHYLNDTFHLWETYKMSMFEIDMLISILYFIDNDVDYVVYEVGLGGRLDATNVITPLVTAITNVSFDHMNILGNTLEAIAFEKAGIVKEGIPLITTETKDVVLNVFKDVSEKHNATLTVLDPPVVKMHHKSFTLSYKEDIVLNNQGMYQKDNANLAIHIVDSLDLEVSPLTIKKGIENTHWAGRFEEVLPDIYLDGAHNMQGVISLVESLDMLPKPWIVVFTALGDKAHHEMLELLIEKVDTLIITEFDFYRAEKANVLGKGLDVVIEPDYKKAIELGKQLKKEGSLLVTGSLYFVSDAREYLLSR